MNETTKKQIEERMEYACSKHSNTEEIIDDIRGESNGIMADACKYEYVKCMQSGMSSEEIYDTASILHKKELAKSVYYEHLMMLAMPEMVKERTKKAEIKDV